MKGKIILLLILILKLSGGFYLPLHFSSNTTFFLTEFNNNKLQLITIHQKDDSRVLIKMNEKEVAQFTIPAKHNDYRVALFTQPYNPALNATDKNIAFKGLCQFHYPLSAVSQGNKFGCAVYRRDQNFKRSLVGQCMLPLRYQSSLCVISGNIPIKESETSASLTADIYSCASCDTAIGSTDWIKIVNISMSLPIIDWTHLAWTNAFNDSGGQFGLQIGVPTNPITKERFELPIRFSDKKKNIVKIEIEINCTKTTEVSDIRTCGAYEMINEDYFSDDAKHILQFEFQKSSDQGSLCNKKDDVLFILVMKNFDSPSTISIRTKKVTFENELERVMNNDGVASINITIKPFTDKISYVPVIERPVFDPLYFLQRKEYVLRNDAIKIYVIETTSFQDVTDKAKCRPLDPSKLKCPLAMQSATDFHYDTRNKQNSDWLLELNVFNWYSIVNVKPDVKAEDLWIILTSDEVLNKVQNWRTIQKKDRKALHTDNECHEIYQVAEVKVLKKISFYDQEKKQQRSIKVDLTDKIPIKNFRLSDENANIYKANGRVFIQGLSSGNILIELITNNNVPISSKSLLSFEEKVTIEDVEVTCVSNISVAVMNASKYSSVNVFDLKVDFDLLDKSSNCQLIVEIKFSDGRRANILSFPKEQYTLKFITNNRVIEVYQASDMFYNYRDFIGETRFHVQLTESRFCDKSAVIFKKEIIMKSQSQAQQEKTLKPFLTSKTTSSPNSSSSKVLEIVTSSTPKSTFQSNGKLSFIIIATVIAAIFLLINALLLCFIKRRYRQKHRRVNGNVTNNPADYQFAGTPLHYEYPPLLPPPGPQVPISDMSRVALASPDSFWRLEPEKKKSSSNSKYLPFIRQFSLPVKGSASKNNYCVAVRPPADKEEMNIYDSHESLSMVTKPDILDRTPVFWSMSHGDNDTSSGVGSLNTNMDDAIKDPYELKDRYTKLSELTSLKKCSDDGHFGAS